MLFQPRPRLLLEKGGTYTLIVNTQVPSPCYRPGRVRRDPGIPEIEYVTVEIIEDKADFCPQVLHDVTHVVPGIVLTSGKRGVLVAVEVDGRRRGSAFVPNPGFEKVEAAAEIPPGIERGEAAAGLPPGAVLLPDTVSAVVFSGAFKRILWVTAVASVPTTGYRARLQERWPPGINPAILLLDFEVSAPAGRVLPVVSTVGAIYKTDFDDRYTAVTVAAGGMEVTVPVIVLHDAGGEAIRPLVTEAA